MSDTAALHSGGGGGGEAVGMHTSQIESKTDTELQCNRMDARDRSHSHSQKTI